MKTRWWLGVVLAAVSFLVGCGGGGGGGNNSAGSVAYTIDWPQRDRDVPELAESVSISMWQKDTNLGTQTVDRTGDAADSVVIFSDMPTGSSSYRLSAYGGPHGTGIWLGDAEGTVSVAAGKQSKVAVNTAMHSTINRLVISCTDWSFIVNPGENLQLYVTAYNDWNQVIPVPLDHWHWKSSSSTCNINEQTGLLTAGPVQTTTTVSVSEDESGLQTSTNVIIGSWDFGTSHYHALLYGRTTGNLERPITFSAILYDPTQQEPIETFQVRWDLDGDGIFDTPFTDTHEMSHQYTAVGEYHPSIEIIPPDGPNVADTELVLIFDHVSPESTTATVEPASGTVDTEFTFTAHAWDSGDQAVHGGALRWDWDDDGVYDTPFIPFISNEPPPTTTLPRTITHKFPAAGLWVVRVQREAYENSSVVLVPVYP